MKIVLLSCSSELSTYGLRLLSACLKKAGHSVQMIFLPNNRAMHKKKLYYEVEYQPHILDQLAELCNDAQLIGISLMTNEYLAAINVTTGLKARGIRAPIIWGGMQPSVEPEECLKYADIICVGEGEDALVELAERINAGEPYQDIQNLWMNTPEGIQCNPVRPPVHDLDSLPLPDYCVDEELIASKERIQPVTQYDIEMSPVRYPRADKDGIFYACITSRGCPFSCTFCCNEFYKRLYSDDKRMRWRSADSVCREIENALKQLGRINTILFVDDNFTARSIAALKDFCDQYKRRIGLPFMAQVSPATIDQERLDILWDGGCRYIVMGIETPNAEAAKLYHREQLHKHTRDAVAMLNRNLDRFDNIRYQFIIDNPYETLEQMLETLRFGLSLPRPWKSKFFSLMLFPGTSIYEKAMQDGLVTDKVSQIYGHAMFQPRKYYINIWVRLYRAQLPPWLLSLMLNTSLVRIMTSSFIDRLLYMAIFSWTSYFIK